MAKNKIIKNEFELNLKKSNLRNKEKILKILWEIRNFQPNLNNFDNYYEESTQLLYNSIFLHEKGFFDNALFNIRNCYELSITTIDIEINSNLEDWNNEEKLFSLNKSLKKLDNNDNFNDFKKNFKEYFDVYSSKEYKLKNKVLHKQGYNNFYTFYNHSCSDGKFKYNFDKELHNIICTVFLTHIFRNPMSYLLSYENIYYRTNNCDEFLYTPKTDIKKWEKYLKIKDLEKKLEETKLIKKIRDEYMKNNKISKWIFEFKNNWTIDINKIDEIDEIDKSTLNNTQKISILLIKNKIIFNEVIFFLNDDEFSFNSMVDKIFIKDKKSLIYSLPFSSKIFNEILDLFKNKDDIKQNISFKNYYITLIEYQNKKYIFSHEQPIYEIIN